MISDFALSRFTPPQPSPCKGEGAKFPPLQGGLGGWCKQRRLLNLLGYPVLELLNCFNKFIS